VENGWSRGVLFISSELLAKLEENGVDQPNKKGDLIAKLNSANFKVRLPENRHHSDDSPLAVAQRFHPESSEKLQILGFGEHGHTS
jgi:hypothetical protein